MLILAFVVTGFASSAYRRERTTLGRAHFVDAQAMLKRGDVKGSLEGYRKALLFSPDRTEYRLALATALINAGQLNEARSHVEQLLQEDPTNGQLNLLLARIAVKRGHIRDAVDDYQRAVYEYWPTSELQTRRQARWELATLLNQTGDHTSAVAELMQLYTNTPANEVPRKIKVGQQLLKYGATFEAEQIFRDLAKQSPHDPDIMRSLGQAYFNAGEYVTARHEFQRAVRAAPRDKESIDSLATTNDVIELDPALPSLSSSEHLRRSQNLLNRVLKNLRTCSAVAADTKLSSNAPHTGGQTSGTNATSSNDVHFAKPSAHPEKTAKPDSRAAPDATVTPSTTDQLALQFEAADKLLEQPVTDNDDRALALQNAAQKFWSERTTACKANPPSDPVLETVLARMGLE